MRVEIGNWKELVHQFGLQDTKEGLLSAKQISRELTRQVNLKAKSLAQVDETFNHMFVKCNTQSDADACFVLSKKAEKELHYDYIGTAN